MGFSAPENINDMRQVAFPETQPTHREMDDILSQSELKTEEANEQTVVPATNMLFQLDDFRVKQELWSSPTHSPTRD